MTSAHRCGYLLCQNLAASASHKQQSQKVRCIEKFIKEFARWVDVDGRIDIWRKEEGGEHLKDVDWVVGA